MTITVSEPVGSGREPLPSRMRAITSQQVKGS